MIVRDAVPQDAAALAEIYNEIVRNSMITFTTAEKSAADWEAEINAGGGLLVLVDTTETLRGYARLGEFRSGPGYAHVAEHSIYISPGTQGRGLGRLLLSALEERAQELGFEILVAGISGTNDVAQRFHRSCGFKEVGRMPGVGQKWGRSLDLVLMQKRLV